MLLKQPKCLITVECNFLFILLRQLIPRAHRPRRQPTLRRRDGHSLFSRVIREGPGPDPLQDGVRDRLINWLYTEATSLFIPTIPCAHSGGEKTLSTYHWSVSGAGGFANKSALAPHRIARERQTTKTSLDKIRQSSETWQARGDRLAGSFSIALLALQSSPPNSKYRGTTSPTDCRYLCLISSPITNVYIWTTESI